MIDAPEAPPRVRSPSQAWALNPYLLILVAALLGTAGEVLLAKGSKLIAGTSATHAALGWFAPLLSLWTWTGILSYISSLLVWLYVLKFVPLSIAFPLINVVQVLVPAAAHIFLHEAVPVRLWAGIGLVFVGILVIARPLMQAEEKL